MKKRALAYLHILCFDWQEQSSSIALFKKTQSGSRRQLTSCRTLHIGRGAWQTESNVHLLYICRPFITRTYASFEEVWRSNSNRVALQGGGAVLTQLTLTASTTMRCFKLSVKNLPQKPVIWSCLSCLKRFTRQGSTRINIFQKHTYIHNTFSEYNCRGPWKGSVRGPCE